jgi:hypothetical protein
LSRAAALGYQEHLDVPVHNPSAKIDEEATQAIRSLYNWADQGQLTSVATSDRPCLCKTGGYNFTSRWQQPFMVWKGAPGESGIYRLVAVVAA